MINLLATLRFNIRAFGLAKGLRLPVYIYGPIKIKSVGTIRINCPIRRQLIVIGANHDTVAAPHTVFNNTGTIEIHGKVYLNYGSVFANKGLVILRGNDLIGNQSDINIFERLDMGRNVSIGFETHISDDDHHYMVNANTHRVYRSSAPITIGNFNWFGSNTFIKKGTVTPDYLIVASPCSMLSKDYSSLPPYTVLAGCPARPVKQGIRRIYNFLEEAKIKDFFHRHPDAEFYQIDANANLDDICKLN
jgi:acetyltransferase-like isoleucine patch superfamily enzyme